MKKDLKALFRENAILHAISTMSGDYRKTNKAYDKLFEIKKKVITEYSKCERENFYEELLNDENDFVRYWASADCLEMGVFEDVAKKILIEILQNKTVDPIILGSVKMVWEVFVEGKWRGNKST